MADSKRPEAPTATVRGSSGTAATPAAATAPSATSSRSASRASGVSGVSADGAFGDATTAEEPSVAAATPAHCITCFQAIIAALDNTPVPKEKFDTSVKCPLFVTWNKASRRGDDWDLRGCIGNLSPIPLSRLKEYACTSAFKDRRFDPIVKAEVPYLQVGVSLLCKYEPASAWNDWKVGVHGIMIDFKGPADGNQYSATFLPQVAPEQGWDHRATVDALIRKAGYPHTPDDALRRSLTVTRYQASKAYMTYAEYIAATST